MAEVLAIALLMVLGLGIFWFLRASPAAIARWVRLLIVPLGIVIVLGLLMLGLRFPALLGLAGTIAAPLIARWLRRRPSGGFSQPGAGQRTEVRTAFLEAWIDHPTGDVGGRVLSGRFAGRTLDSLP